MAQRTLIRGGTVIAVDPQLGELASGEVPIEDGAIAAVGTALGVDAARLRRLAIESRDDVMRRADRGAGAPTGGEWIPEAYVAATA